MHFVDIAAHIAAGSLAATKLLTIAQPIWDKMPKWLSAALPIFLLALPQIAAQAGLVHSDSDLEHLFAVSVALLLPGVVVGAAAAKKPSENHT
jgi:hypothetical protein